MERSWLIAVIAVATIAALAYRYSIFDADLTRAGTIQAIVPSRGSSAHDILFGSGKTPQQAAQERGFWRGQAKDRFLASSGLILLGGLTACALAWMLVGDGKPRMPGDDQ